MFDILEVGDTHKMKTVMRVDEITHSLISRGDSRYLWSGLDVDLYDVNIYGSGLQTDKDDSFPVNLYFTGTITSSVLADIRKWYEIGKLIKVKGCFQILNASEEKEWSVIIVDPIASFLPKVTIAFYEKTMEEIYLPQMTIESTYEMPGDVEQ